jgi:hypothetical protein
MRGKPGFQPLESGKIPLQSVKKPGNPGTGNHDPGPPPGEHEKVETTDYADYTDFFSCFLCVSWIIITPAPHEVSLTRRRWKKICHPFSFSVFFLIKLKIPTIYDIFMIWILK